MTNPTYGPSQFASQDFPSAVPSLAAASEDSEASPSSGADSGARIQEIDEASEKFVELRELHQQPVPYLRACFRELTQRYRQIAFGIKGRCISDSLADFAAIDGLTPDEIESLKHLINHNLLARQGDKKSYLSGPHAIGSRQVYLTTVAIDRSEDLEVVASLCFAMIPQSKAELDLASAQLRADLAAAVNLLPALQKSQAPQGDSSVDLTARVSRYESTREFAFALVNSLAQRYACQQVAFGVANHKKIKVLAISGTDKFKDSSPGIVDIQQAMEETLDANEMLAFQPHGMTATHKAMPVHTQWGSSTRTAVCSIPLMAGDKCIAVVSLRRDPTTGFGAAELAELDSVIGPFGAAVELAQRGERSLKEHFKESAARGFRSAKKPGTAAGRMIRTVVLAAALIFIFGWLPYKPFTPCVLVPSDLTQTLAAFDMELEEVFVRSGDRVQAGTLLAKFDTRQLELERSTLESQRDQAEVDVRAALVEGDPAAASLAKASSAVFAAQLAAVEQKIQNCRIEAPHDGMVVAADLDQKLGQVFPQGEPILSFAPMNSFELEIRVPEHMARHITVEQTGSFAPAADPANSVSYSIESISGSAELIDGKNVFVAKAKLDRSSDHFRQGMEGFASTYTGWRPIPWIVFHRAYEYAASGFWF